MIGKELQQLFVETAKEKLHFLVTDYGFSGPYVIRKPYVGFITVMFKAQNLAVECSLDLREGDIECKILRLQKGKLPKAYHEDDQKRIVREHLWALLTYCEGVRALEYTKIGEMPFKERVPIEIEDEVKMLRKYGQKVLSDDPSIFECYDKNDLL